MQVIVEGGCSAHYKASSFGSTLPLVAHLQRDRHTCIWVFTRATHDCMMTLSLIYGKDALVASVCFWDRVGTEDCNKCHQLPERSMAPIGAVQYAVD